MTTACAALASFFAGIAFACAGGVIKKRITKRPRTAMRWTAFFITLSFAIVCAALAVIFFPGERITLDKFAAPYYCAFVGAGIAAGIWRRRVLPLLVLLYACYGLWFRAPLAKLFPAPERAQHLVRMDSDTVIIIDGVRYEFDAAEFAKGENGRGWTIVFEQYALPARWLVPFPANFFRLAGAAQQKNPASLRLTTAGIEDALLFSALRTPFAKALLTNHTEQTLFLPVPEIYPAEYRIDCAIKKQKFTAMPTKIF